MLPDQRVATSTRVEPRLGPVPLPEAGRRITRFGRLGPSGAPGLTFRGRGGKIGGKSISRDILPAYRPYLSPTLTPSCALSQYRCSQRKHCSRNTLGKQPESVRRFSSPRLRPELPPSPHIAHRRGMTRISRLEVAFDSDNSTAAALGAQPAAGGTTTSSSSTAGWPPSEISATRPYVGVDGTPGTGNPPNRDANRGPGRTSSRLTS